jgi:hypothetical protein
VRDILLTIKLDDGTQIDDFVKVDHVGLKYCLPSKYLLESTEKFNENCKQKYLMPKVNDEGNFSGSYLMHQTACFINKPLKLMEEQALNCNNEDFFDEKDKRYVYNWN